MVTLREKKSIQITGFLLILLSLLAFFYPEVFIFTIYPYREYALPLGVLGVIVVVVGFALPSTQKSFQRKTGRFCSNCGKKIHQEISKFCPYCGTRLAD